MSGIYRPPKSLNYLGGKSYYSSTGTGRWVASLLPKVSYKACYVEPFAGMLGVLLQRPPKSSEIASDKDQRIIRWWRVLQHKPSREALIDRLTWTPLHEQEYLQAKQMLTETDISEADHAWAVTVVIHTSYLHCLPHSDHEHTINHFRVSGVRGKVVKFQVIAEQLKLLAERISNVQFVIRDANEIIARHKKEPGNLIYCDPPYPSAVISEYYDKDFNKQDFVEAVTDAQARIAVSGYNTEWDDLPGRWWKKEHRTVVHLGPQLAPTTRTEALWTNYDPDVHANSQMRFDDLITPVKAT